MLVSNHNAVFYTWHELIIRVLKNMSNLSHVVHASKMNMCTSDLHSFHIIEQSIVINDQYYEKQSLLCNNAIASV